MMQDTFDPSISKRLGIMVFALVVALILFHLAGFTGVSAAARVSL